ncbi:single-stranded DNA-binding protein [Alkalihalobacillus oceani]|uniref:Single-stranded DNA-binding protein n=1 Tax=Halalkalibacter oceani TaxID=1653776 RepID=A0A9X2DT14_9BACI|nr:single-stranded DNA-binding protein [Halalkalibacter oceani]MCM3716591.1 single-stranded DNA-binding protein [Halalkalibacter oceani]
MEINRTIFSGRLVADPKLVYVKNKTVAVCTFTVAQNRKHGEGTNYIPVIAWREYAERLANDLKKGMSVTVDGYLQSREREDLKTHLVEVHVEFVKYG